MLGGQVALQARFCEVRAGRLALDVPRTLGKPRPTLAKEESSPEVYDAVAVAPEIPPFVWDVFEKRGCSDETRLTPVSIFTER